MGWASTPPDKLWLLSYSSLALQNLVPPAPPATLLTLWMTSSALSRPRPTPPCRCQSQLFCLSQPPASTLLPPRGLPNSSQGPWRGHGTLLSFEWPTGQIPQPWRGRWGLGQLPEASGLSSLLAHARASSKYCHRLQHRDPALSP